MVNTMMVNTKSGMMTVDLSTNICIKTTKKKAIISGGTEMGNLQKSVCTKIIN